MHVQNNNVMSYYFLDIYQIFHVRRSFQFHQLKHDVYLLDFKSLFFLTFIYITFIYNALFCDSYWLEKFTFFYLALFCK